MIGKYTIYTTYMLDDDPTIKSSDIHYTTPIHCNYVNKFTTDSLLSNEISLTFNTIDDFKFLSTNDGLTGYTANKIYLIAQIVENVYDEDNMIYIETDPVSNLWRRFDVTDQIRNHVSGNTLTANELIDTVFKVPFTNFSSSGESYDLSYLNYPSSSSNTQLLFGDEEFFLGNVDASILANVYTTNLGLNLKLGEFNSSTNSSWDGNSDVYISEIGIYDDEKNLIAIGKLNTPLRKNNSISRNIFFQVDF
jgi:hypothetical protein